MTRKLQLPFLPGMGSRGGAFDAHATAEQFRRRLNQWLAEKPGIKPVNIFFRGTGPGRRQKTVCAVINVSFGVSALTFLDELKTWVTERSSIRLADAKFSKVSNPKDGSCLKATFRVQEGDGRVRLRPVRRGSRPRKHISVKSAAYPLHLDRQEPAGAMVV